MFAVFPQVPGIKQTPPSNWNRTISFLDENKRHPLMSAAQKINTVLIVNLITV